MEKTSSLYITNFGIMEPLGQTQILPYLDGLSQAGIELYLVSFEKKANLINAERVTLQSEQLKRWGINWLRLRYHYRWGNVWDVFRGFFTAVSLIRRKRIKVIHARASIPAIISFVLSRIFALKFIYDRRATMLGDFTDDVNKENIFKFSFFARLLDKLEERILARADAVIVLSGTAADMLKQEKKHISGIEKKITVIPCCTDLCRFNLAQRKDKQLLKKHSLEDKFIFVYSGSLGTCYRFDEMLRFWTLAKQRIDNAHFLILTQSGEELARKMIAQNNLTRQDFTILNLNPADVPRYIGLGDIALLFIKQTLSKLASCPTKVGECLACGIPLIVNTMMGDIGRIVEEKGVGVVVRDYSEPEYTRKIEECLQLLRQNIDGSVSRRCFQVAQERFSLTMGNERYQKVYQEIGGSRRL